MRSPIVSIASIDLNLMFVLHTVLAERNVARAAERLHVTPSAVSNALARLRDVLGDPLVTRKGRGIVPTPRATELAPAIARAIDELEHALHSGSFDAATLAGHQRVAEHLAQPGERVAHRRGRDVEALGGARHVALGEHGVEHQHQVQVDGGNAHGW